MLDVDAELFGRDCALLTNEAQKAEPIKSETEQHTTIQITQREKSPMRWELSMLKYGYFFTIL